jgi:hypothetical protein
MPEVGLAQSTGKALDEQRDNPRFVHSGREDGSLAVA